jgi:hypothetical protein
MKHSRKLLLIVALAATTVSSVPISSHASRIAPPAQLQAATLNGPVQDANGALFALACGIGIRYWPALGWNFAYNVGVVGSCMLALLFSAG